MFYTQCWKCNERWGLGTASTCKCPDETPQHTWQGLTDEEIRLEWSEFWEAECHPWAIEFARDIEAKLKEKNT
jgi:hypothetical protein